MTPAPKVAVDWKPGLAREEDIPALEALIPVSVRALQAPYYSAAQMEAALGPVFGVDRQLIRIRAAVAFLTLGWCLGTESNRRHKDFQSSALPTELPS